MTLFCSTHISTDSFHSWSYSLCITAEASPLLHLSGYPFLVCYPSRLTQAFHIPQRLLLEDKCALTRFKQGLGQLQTAEEIGFLSTETKKECILWTQAVIYAVIGQSVIPLHQVAAKCTWLTKNIAEGPVASWLTTLSSETVERPLTDYTTLPSPHFIKCTKLLLHTKSLWKHL